MIPLKTGDGHQKRRRRLTPTKRQPEFRLQCAIVSWLRLVRPKCIWYAVPNGGWRHPSIAVEMKMSGVRAGVLDLGFVLPGGRAAFIEIKAKGESLSDKQIAFMDAARALDAQVDVAFSIEDVENALTRWGVEFERAVS